MAYTKIKAWLDEQLQEIKDTGLFKEERPITTAQGADIETSHGPSINFCANNYLGMANHPEVIEAVAHGLRTHGFGMASVRFICGTQDIHQTLERRISDYLGTDDAILHSSCFDANTGLFETLLGPDDAIISDALNHASIIDGVRLCRAQRKIYRHNDMVDLEEKLKETRTARFRIISTDGVFSMQVDMAHLKEICGLAEQYDSLVMVDHSHATGILGPDGRGSPAELGVADQVDIITSTLGKALGGATGYEIDSLYHLGSLLSVTAESNRRLSHQVNIVGLLNVLEAASENRLERVIIPSSIAAFGLDTPHDNTPNDTLQRPNSLYGISKVFGELMGNYYFEKLGLDVRGVRLPGVVSWKVEPSGGTTDYAVAAFYGAIQHQRYTCYLRPGTYLPMMYVPDAILAMIQVAEAEITNLKHHADFNVNSMSFAPEELAEAIQRRIPEFTMDFQVDPLRQAIADSWPNSLDDTVARQEWGWQPEYGIDAMVEDMHENLCRKLGYGPAGRGP